MLAVSRACSQMPPDHLQAAPVLVLRAFAAYQFGKSLAIVGLKSEPGDSAEHHTSGKKCCPKPTTIRCQSVDSTVVRNTNSQTSFMALGNNDHITDARCQPDEPGKRTPMRRNWQQQNHRKTEDGRCQPRQHHKTTQQWVRCEFAQVCVQRHVLVRLPAVPFATSSP